MAICNLSSTEVRRLEQDGTTPKCWEHRHISALKARVGVKAKIYSWVGDDGRRVTPTQIWKPVRSGSVTVIQLVDPLTRR